MIGEIAFGLFGLAVLIGIAWLFSNNKSRVDWTLVGIGVALQIAFAMFVLLTPFGAALFKTLGGFFVALIDFTKEGASFIFGDLVRRSDTFGFIFAFQVLPTIIFFAAFMGVMYHLGVMQIIVRGMTWAITRVMKVSGAETTSVCASIFIGQTEAPLTVRPYIPKMTESELLTLMIGGMAHIAGGVMATYIGMLGGDDPVRQTYFATHFLAASIMAAPATILIAKILIPELGQPLTRGTVKMEVEKTASNVIDAAASGAADGLKLALNIGAMLLAFIALIALLNAPIKALSDFDWWGAGSLTQAFGEQLSIEVILGYVLAPIAWVIGVPWEDARLVGSLIGTKLVLNEFVAYINLSAIPIGEGAKALSEHAQLIATYALCGFANFSSIAIQIGGIGGIAPERRADLARFGLRAVLGGTLATLMTATIAGVLSQFT
jgi:concentrative nucleoside transporter, CNT family